MTDDRWFEALVRAVSSWRRQAASYFWWFDRSAAGKALAEVGAVETLLDAMAQSGNHEYSSPKASKDDWPDVEATNSKGQLVAFEVTELVTPTVASGGPPSPWEDADLLTALDTRVEAKDTRSFHGNKYSEVVLLVHTDEMYLDPTRVEALLATRVFRLRHGNLTKAILLFGYQHGTCPYIVLTLAA